ncbi:MAG: NfeD family protein, partial [Cytophagales bacterium]
PGANIGAATVVTQDGAAAPDKYQSFMRSIMRSTAETKGRDPKIAEAMVDEKINLDSVSPEGTVLTFTVDEAIENDYCEAKVRSIEEILELNGWENAEIIEFEVDSAEKIISIFLNPVISSVLILIIVGGIYFELQTPGVGFPILASLIAAILYFIPFYLNGLAANWEILMFAIGIVLLILEVFVIPGFGIAGIAGLTFTIGGLVLVMLNNDWLDFTFVPNTDIFISLASILAGLFGAIILMFIGGVRLSQSNMFKRIALETTFERSQGYSSNFKTMSLQGKKGKAHTILRPSGKVIIDDEIYDAYSRGEHIDQGSDIVVVSEEGTSLKVKKV